MASVYHLLYRSAASGYIADTAINDILDSSRRNNSADGITGLLLFRSGFFLQLLEGQETAVQAALKRIAKDPRHTELKILLECKSDAPIFPEWNMGFIEETKASAELFRAVDLALQESMKSGEAGRSKVVNALKAFSGRDLGQQKTNR